VDRLRRWWKPGLALLLALIALQAGVSLLVRTARAHAFLTRQLQNSFGRDVEVRQFSASFFPSPQLDAYGVSVGEDPAFGQEYFLRAERLSAGLRWLGLLRGRFELGTLQLERPSLVLVRNRDGRWNLERWLPAAPPAQTGTAAAPSSGNPSGLRAVSAFHLQRIEISDGRANFKLGDDKTPFAFLQVEGTVEQTASGRWRLDLTAEPWRSGVPLQLAGTVRVRGDVGGTSARLQPARFQVSWDKSSLADVFRLIGGRDFGVRGLFAAEATAASIGAEFAGRTKMAPGDWSFSVQARALGIHRWDLTERDDNPRIGVRINGRWNPGVGEMAADEFVVETPHSNLRGTASLKNVAGSSLEVRMDSAGVQAADLLDWYRAFRGGVAEEIEAEQYFTGAASFRGWPVSLNELAFSSPGGRWTIPGFIAPLKVQAVRGGTQREKLTVDPFAVTIPASESARASAKTRAAISATSGASSVSATASLSFFHDFYAKAGGIHIEGQAARVQDVFAIANAFGRPLQNGWELKGKAAADLHWDWSAASTPAWNGRADLTQATLQVAGLNQPLQLDNLHAEWRNTARRFTLARVAAFGASWSGSVEQPRILPSDFGETEVAPWTFQLQADHLDAAELDRWIGPRARPGWLQRLLPSGLGGESPPAAPSAVLRRIRASGDLRVDELTIEKIKLKQFRAQTRLDALKLSIGNVQAQWSGGEVRGSVEAVFSARPRYDVSASFDRISIVQTPWLARLSDRLAGSAYGSLQIRAAGVGREALLESLAGKGEFRLTNVELRGWDVAGTMAQGEWQTGTSHWTTGIGAFQLSDNGFELNSLRLVSSSGEFLVKGSVSFSQVTDLTAESHATGRNARSENTIRFMQISGPLAEPKVSLERATAQQPGD
jgi:AsmA family/AsmA-like C-terminal region